MCGSPFHVPSHALLAQVATNSIASASNQNSNSINTNGNMLARTSAKNNGIGSSAALLGYLDNEEEEDEGDGDNVGHRHTGATQQPQRQQQHAMGGVFIQTIGNPLALLESTIV